MVQKCVHICVNTKIIPVKTTPGIWVRGRRENVKGSEFMYDIFDLCKNLCKCHNVLSPSTTIKEKNLGT
jgi:hypothetical protein